ncbi:uncharacterized protein A1O9_05622 [Exophiala aquamarina CBS 119918]|uniref:Glutamyl-tRNA amidotransferase complex subunit Gta3 domain-containing protein n=1 Tax=Exophiala aquamarina CBS 119918 TaxID=1182545 RepID=A0A072PC84_9EURO|nr:uncharacterized protein A1O9_05622 [Exophiala aquamarina CBS 119918]KEF57704.1 hypothetical protein A1O9_05622 [Exophiala aquamarina CBS 119918]
MPRISYMNVGGRLRPNQTIVKDIKINPQIRELLERPTWSVASLLPPRAPPTNQRSTPPGTAAAAAAATASFVQFQEDTQEITKEKLRHLLKLSALPPPKDDAEEEEMLSTLRAQVHFVKEIQKVDTTGVQPLVSIRDETRDNVWASMMTEEKLEEFFKQEEKVGVNGTIRRRQKQNIPLVGNRGAEAKAHDIVDKPFSMSRGDSEQGRRIGQYFYVKRSKKQDRAAVAEEVETCADPT